jgi:predicted RNA-binding Zn ribbon-like protein
MSNSSLSTLPDDILFDTAFPATPPVPPGFTNMDDEMLLQATEQMMDSKIDTKTGAPANVRVAVSAATRPANRLEILRTFYPDAMPVEVYDPASGAAKYGRGNFIYKNPQTGVPTLFDEDLRLFGVPVPGLRDILDVGPEIAETAGAIGGATAGLAAAGGTTVASGGIGAVAAPALVMAGEGVGSAAAREAYLSILRYFNEIEDPRTGLEQLVDVSTTAGINAVAGPVVNKAIQGVKFVAGAPIRYGINSISAPAKEALDKLTRAGVTNPTAAQVSANPVLELIENSALMNLLPSSKIMRENAARTVKQLEERALALADKFGGRRSFAETAESVVESAQKARERYDAQTKAMYDGVRDLMPDIKSTAPNTRAFVEKYIADSQTATGAPFLHPALEQAAKLLKDAENGVLTFDRLRDLRTSLLADLESAASGGAKLKGQDRKQKELVGYITRDIDALVEEAAVRSRTGDLFEEGAEGVVDRARDIEKLYAEANAFVKKNQGPGGSIRFMDKVIAKGGDEARLALNLVTQGMAQGGDRLAALRDKFTDDEFKVLTGYMLGSMGLPNFGARGAREFGEEGLEQTGAEALEQAGFSANRFISNFNKLSPEAQNILFQGGQFKELGPALNDLTFALDRVSKTAAAMNNPSGTARAVYALSLFAPFGAEIAAGATTGSDGFEFGFGSLIAPFAAAKLMTSPRFVKWLAEGVQTAAYNPNSFGQHVRRLVQIWEAEPEIREEIQAIVDGMQGEILEPLAFEGSASTPSLAAIPEDNEMRFRESVPSTVADKLLPSKEEMEGRMADIAASPSVFDPLPLMEPVSPSEFRAAMSPSPLSPTLLPDEEDRLIAARQAGIGQLLA